MPTPHYLAALLMARAEGDDESETDLADLMGDPDAAGELLASVREGKADKSFRKAAAHAPKGGVTVGGTEYTGGQFIPAEVMEQATAAEKAAVEGDRGGGQTAAKPDAKESRRASKAADVAAQAADIEVSDDPVGGVKVGRNDLDAIEGMLSTREQQRLERHLNAAREEYIEDYDPDDDIDDDDRGQAAGRTGWDDSGIQDKANEIAEKWVGENTDDDEKEGWQNRLTGTIDKWYRGTSAFGADGLEELADHLDGDPDWDYSEVAEAVRGLKDKAHDEISGDLEDKREELRRAKMEEYDTFGDREEWLQEWHDEHGDDDRVAGEPQKGRWGKDPDGDYAYHFATSDGSEYKANVVLPGRNDTGISAVPEFMFSDSDNSVNVTGKAGAKTALEVFGAVTPAAVAILTKNDYDAMQFSAAEPSRQKLYDRLVRSTTAAAPEYAAVAVTLSPTYKKYMLVKRDKMGEYMEHIKGMTAARNLPADAVEELVKSAGGRLPDGVEILTPATDDEVAEWNTEDGWADDEPDDTQPAD